MILTRSNIIIIKNKILFNQVSNQNDQKTSFNLSKFCTDN